MPKKRLTHRLALKSAAGGALATALLMSPVFEGAAFAADQGNWTPACDPLAPQPKVCMLRYIGGVGGNLASSLRDSNFTGDIYPLGNGPMNDHVTYVQNNFFNTETRAFRNADYNNNGFDVGTTCIPRRTNVGPYSDDGSAKGLSSFKNCA